MKKSLLLLASTLLLGACGNNSPYKLELKVATPAGSPATAFYKYLGDNEHLEVNSVANNVIGYLSDATSDKDIVVVPTNAGIAAINKGAKYKIAATITFGNFFLLSTGKDEDETLSEGDKVLAFQENGVAGKLFNYVYGDKNLDVTYLVDAAAVKTKVLSEDVDASYILLAQPVVTAVLSQKSNFKLYANVQEDYKNKTNGKEVTQASIFVKDSTDKAKAQDLLDHIKEDVESLVKDPTLLVKNTENIEDEVFSSKLTGTKQLVTNLIKNNNQLGLGYKEALANKASIDAFISTLGLGATSEEIYFSYSK